MSAQRLAAAAAAARKSQAAQPPTSRAVSGVLPAFPNTAPQPPDDDEHNHNHLPLPDHFPEPHGPDHSLPGLPPNMAQCVAVKNHGLHDNSRVPDDAKEGVRRITDKYAAPAMLHVNGSVCSSDAFSPSLSPLESWPASTSPSTNQSASPTSLGSPVMNGRHGTDPNSDNTPRSSAGLQNSTAARQNGNNRLAPLSISAFSDASSDMSDASPSPALTGSVRSGSTSGGKGGMLGVGGGGGGGRYQSVSGISLSTSLGEGVREEDVQQVEMFYRSHRSEVTVCRCLANLYFGSVTDTPTTSPPHNTNGRVSPAGDGGGGGELWEFVTTGIPVLVLDSGDHLRSRQLSVVVAEKGTGFVLWKDVVSHLTTYSCLHANFHTLRISSDNHKLAGLSFDDSKAAAGFAAAMLKLTSDPDDELLMLSKKGKKKKKKKQEGSKKMKFKPPKKSDISQPCCFQHVTKLERPQMTGLMPLPPNGFPPPPGGGSGGSVSSLSDVFQDRLTVSSSRARSPCSELSDASAEH
ncbi:hypothetical protein ACOMHN_067648 [Nucella lapillus]